MINVPHNRIPNPANTAVAVDDAMFDRPNGVVATNLFDVRRYSLLIVRVNHLDPQIWICGVVFGCVTRRCLAAGTVLRASSVVHLRRSTVYRYAVMADSSWRYLDSLSRNFFFRLLQDA